MGNNNLKNFEKYVKPIVTRFMSVLTIIVIIQLGIILGPFSSPVKAGPIQTVTGIVTDYYTGQPIPNVKISFAKNGKPDANYGETTSVTGGYYSVQIHNGAGNICVIQAPAIYNSYCTSLDNFTTFYDINTPSRDVVNPNRTVINIKLRISDSTPPAINLTASPTAPTNRNVNIAANVSDNGSGVAIIKWAAGNKPISYFTSSGVILSGSTPSFSVSVNGTYTVYAKDNAGNARVQTITISNIDVTPPAISLTALPTASTNGSVNIIANVSDTGSGVERIKWEAGNKPASYFASSGIILSGSMPSFSVSTNGIYTVYAIDNAGNGNVGSITVSNISNTNTSVPTTPTITVTPTGWTNGSASFTIGGSTISSGTIKYQYRIDQGVWSDYPSTSVPVSDEGNHTIYAKAVDVRNQTNTSSTTTANALIDKTGPTTPTIIVTPEGWTNGDVTFMLGSSEDSGSGLQKYQYRIDGGAWTDYTTSETISVEGDHTVDAKALDNAGNESTVSTKSAQIDKTAPTGEITADTEDWIRSLHLTCTGSDNLSGVNSIQTPDGNWVTGRTTSYTVTSNGTYTFDIKDSAGNTTEKSITINNIDGTSSILKLGAYMRNNPGANYIYQGDEDKLSAVKSMSITMAMIVDIESHDPKVDISITGRYGNTSITYKKYELKDNLIDTNTEETIISSYSETRFTGNSDGLNNWKKVDLLTGKKYIIIFNITPTGNKGDTIEIKATVDNQTVYQDVILDIKDLPDLE